MEVELIYKDSSFVFNISPLMPISYLRTLSQKSFHIPEYSLNLSYQNIIIDKQYNETSLKELFKTSSRIIIKVSDGEPKSLMKTFLNSTITSTTLKTLKMEEKKLLLKKHFDINKTHLELELENDMKRDKCEVCKKREIDYFCREECKFLCKVDKNTGHLNHKFIIVQQGNIEQCGYNYQKQLIQEIQNQKDEVKILIEKSSKERLTEKIEEVYDILAKIGDTEREIMENFPCLPLESITNTDYNEITRNIYSINDNIKKKNSFNIKDKKPFFKQLQNEDFNLDSLNKDIESIKRKYDFQDMLIEIIEQIRNNLNNLNETLNEIWNGNRYNIIAFSHEMETILKRMKKKFIVNNTDSEEDISDNESELEELFFENKRRNNTGISNIILPKLSVKQLNHKKDKKLPKGNFPLFNSLNFDRRKRMIGKNNKTEKTNNFDSENDSNSNSLSSSNKGNIKKNNYISRRGKSNKNINYNKGDEREDFNLNQVLLTENEVDKGPKRPPRRNSVRMSIFIRNMNKVDTVSTSKLMKVKKKKKKYT